MSFGRILAIIALLALAFLLLVGWMGMQRTPSASGAGVVQRQQKAAYQPRIQAQQGTHAYYVELVRYDARYVGLDETIFLSQITLESNCNPKARSATGDLGIAQFQPETAAHLANPLGEGSLDVWNPEQALLAAALLMKSYVVKYGGSYPMALAAYNAGEPRVDRAIRQARAQGTDWQSYLPASTRTYIYRILQGSDMERKVFA